MKRVEPFAVGTLVHHRGAIHSVGQAEHPDGGLRGGWATVQNAVMQGDGTYEYEVRADRGIAGEQRPDGETTWWGSHHINRALPVPAHTEEKGEPK
jgi:hypothetical protein